MPSLSRRAIGAFALIGAIVLALLAGFGWAAGWLGGRRISGGDIARALEANSGGAKPGSSITLAAAIATASPMGTLTRKIQCQLPQLVR